LLKAVIPVTFSKVTRVIHLADTHIRLFKRHQEYRETLGRLINTLLHTVTPGTVIVHCGDVVHSKTDLSPEMVETASWFLGSLAKIAPTIVIAGNHDLNVANPNRLDALTPITENLNDPNLHYLKYSGVYSCADVDFAVLSIIGDRADWPTVQDCSAPTKIALFHGPVHNAQTDIGYTITNRHVMVETFDGFDMALLGDIHRHQALLPTVVYAGSTIQQNHGEDIKGHGWVDWNAASRTFQFHELLNEYGYYTLRIEDGTVPPLDNMPKNARLRIFAGDMDASEIKKLVASIRANHTVTELAINRLPTVGKTRRGVETGTVLDIQSVDYQNKLITEYLHNTASDIAPDVLERVLKINTEMNDQIVSDDPTRKLLWTPISLKFDNLFTYGENNYVNFKNLNGVVGLFAPNASGKSSIPDAICFALYDKTPRTIRAAHIMNTREEKCSVEFRFEISGIEYVVERRGTKNKKGEVKVDVDFYRISDTGLKVSLNGEQRKDTNLIIRNYVGDFDDFVLTALSSQSNNSLFIDRGQADRKDMMSQFMGLTIFDKLHALATEESKSAHIALKRFEKDDFTQDLVAVQDELTRVKKENESKDALLNTHRQEFGNLEGQINQFVAKKLPVLVSNLNISELERQETRLMSEMTQLMVKRRDCQVRSIAVKTHVRDR
jgi:DNA repair exonuclease SbcCD nuclease subunit